MRLILVGALLGSLATASLEASVWEPVGPDGGHLRAFAQHPSDPSVVYAASREATIFRSADAGSHWSFVGNIGRTARDDVFISGPELDALAIDRSQPATLYAAIADQLYRSTDAGGSWSARGKVPGSRRVRQLISVVAPQSVLLARVEHLDVGVDSGIERSIDGGLTWSVVALPADEPPGEALFLVSSGADARPVFAVTWDGVLESRDSGSTWAESPTPTQGPGTLAFAASDASTRYFIDSDQRVHRTTDGGEHWDDRGEWTSVNAFVGASVLQLVVDAREPSVLYLLALHTIPRSSTRRLHVSENGGLSWTTIDHPGGLIQRATLLASLGSSPATLLIGGEDSIVATSRDRAQSFVASDGLQATAIQALAIPPRPPTILYAGSWPNTVHGSLDRGTTWSATRFYAPPLPTVLLSDVQADPQQPSTVWTANAITLHQSLDAGGSWRTAIPGGCLGHSALAVAPSDGRIVYAGLDAPTTTEPPCGLQKSLDGGSSWALTQQPPSFAGARAITVDPLDPNRVYLIQKNGQLVLSVDGAATWELVRDDLDVTVVEPDPLRPTKVYAGTVDRGLWQSTDRGESWFPLAGAGLPPGRIADLLAHPVDPDLLYVSQAGTGVFVSRDGGLTFAALGQGLPSGAVSGPLAIEARLPSAVYAGTRGAGVWRVVDEQAATACVEDEWTLCLGGGRFKAQARWRDFKGRSGPGRAVTLTGDSGYFWFFSPDNLELLVKALDGRSLNDRFWVFYGALSNVEFELVVTDTQTGEVNAYFNPERTFASRGDTAAFPRAPSQAARSARSPARTVAETTFRQSKSQRATSSCVADDLTLCVRDGRFRVRVDWKDFKGSTGVGHARPLNETTGTFWFFNEANVEIAIKILDGRSINDRFWVFYGALSNVEYRITVEDTTTGAVRNYFNPSGQFASRGDTEAFHDP